MQRNNKLIKRQILYNLLTRIYCDGNNCVYVQKLIIIVVSLILSLLLAAGKIRMNDDYVYAFNVVHPYYYSRTRLRLL